MPSLTEPDGIFLVGELLPVDQFLRSFKNIGLDFLSRIKKP